MTSLADHSGERRRLAPVALVLTFVGLLAAPFLATPAASAALPISDPEAVGSIGLCNAAGQQITQGKVSAAPFIWRAISTTAASGAYAAAGRTATLYAYQPRADVPSGDWSGQALTASAEYSAASHPEAAATRSDQPLSSFTDNFKPTDHGLVELRIFLGAPGQEPFTETYPATFIQVTGNAWKVVGTVPTVNCRAYQARSLESVVLPASSTSGTHHSKGSSTTTANNSTSTSTKQSSAQVHSPGTTTNTNTLTTASDAHPSGGHTGLIALLAGLVVLFGISGAGLARRRHKPATDTPAAPAADLRKVSR